MTHRLKLTDNKSILVYKKVGGNVHALTPENCTILGAWDIINVYIINAFSAKALSQRNEYEWTGVHMHVYITIYM